MRNNPLPPNLIHVQAHALCFVQNFFLFLVYWGLFVLIIVDFFPFVFYLYNTCILSTKYNGLRYFIKCVFSFLATIFYIMLIIHVVFFKRRTADVKSVGYSELFVLSREDVLEALKDHPEAEVKELFYTLK